MRGILTVALVSGLLATSNVQAADATFVEACLGKTKILESTLSCVVTTNYDRSTMTFELVRGEKMNLTATGIFGKYKKSVPVERIQNLPPRIVQTGIVDHTVRFVARGESVLATVALPCDQDRVALLGMTKQNSSHMPLEYVTACTVK